MSRPAIKVTSANVKMSEVSGVVTVGPESAKLLSKKLGRKVEPGEQFDVGVLSYYHSNPFKRLWGSIKASRSHIFSKQLKQ